MAFINESITELRAICHPSKEHRKDVYRKISLYCIKPLLKLGCRANHITLSRLFFLAAFIVLFLQSSLLLNILAIVSLQLMIFFDTLDGAIARYRKESSFLGELYDLLLDYTLNIFVIPILLGIKVYILFGNDFSILLGFIASFFYFLTAILRASYHERSFSFEKKRSKNRLFRFVNSDSSRLNGLLVVLFVLFRKIDLLLLFIFIISFFKLILQIYYLHLCTKKTFKSKEFKLYFILVIEMLRVGYMKTLKKRYNPYFNNDLKQSKLGNEFLKQVQVKKYVK